MDKQISANDGKREEIQTGVHLLMACVVSVFNVMLIIVTVAMSWELWTIPMAVLGVLVIWVLHIGEKASEALYEHLCVGLLLVEFFYYGAHKDSLFNMPIMLGVLLFMLALLDKKYLLYLSAAMYVLELLYHILVLHTVSPEMAVWDFVRLGVGAAVMAVAMMLSGYMIKRRVRDTRQYNQVKEQLEEANQKNADFLSNISHELRTPINMVMGLSEVALGQEIPSGLREKLQSINLAGKRLAGQINDILDYTEIVGGTLATTQENYILSSVVNDVAAVAAEQISGRDLEIVFDMDADIPSVLIGDAEKLSRVLRILLQNAVKFTEEGGIYVRIGHRRESYGVNLDITILDTGIGMTDAQLRRIGEDFYQADTGSSRCAGGLGLGIPIAQGLLSKMEGFIFFESQEKKGTQVHITIPQGVADEAPGMAVSDPKKYCVGCYFRQGKYSRNEVREFYDNMFQHLIEGLGIEGYRVYHFEDMDKLLHSHNLTHLFIAQEEYEEDRDYYEELGKTICVMLFVRKGYALSEKSCLNPVYLPLFALPILNLLNGEAAFAAEHSFTCFGVHALVVDDEEMNLVVARGILSSYGMQVDTCSGGMEAIEQCTDTAYDIIFLDHMMPGLDGIETLKRLREINNGAYQNLAIIALTANAISGAREMFKSEGFTEFVPKPIERSVLERVLRSVLPGQFIQYGAVSGGKPSSQQPVCQEEMQGELPIRPAADVLPAPSAEPGQPALPGSSAQPVQPLEYLRRVGMNVDMGLNYCGGMEDFYVEMLQLFYTQSMERRAEIVALYEEEDWQNYAIRVHALKSTSLTIGAEQLSEQAKSLERAGKEGNVTYIRENHHILLQLYETVCKSIISCVGGTDPEKEAGQEGGADS